MSNQEANQFIPDYARVRQPSNLLLKIVIALILIGAVIEVGISACTVGAICILWGNPFLLLILLYGAIAIAVQIALLPVAVVGSVYIGRRSSWKRAANWLLGLYVACVVATGLALLVAVVVMFR